MNQDISIIGFGPVGKATAERLAERGQTVRILQRNRPKGMPENAQFVAVDATDLAALREATRGSAQIVLAIGLPYVGKVWREMWPKIMENTLQAAEAHQARVVFVDNLYMYGPQTEPLVETMPLTDAGVKPSVRAAITRAWLAARDKVKFAALRAPDFYGPGVTNSHLGAYAFGALAKGKAAMFLGNPDLPHDIAYVPDFARGVVTLLDAPDDAFGQAWHLPCAPIQTPRDLIIVGARTLGVAPRVNAMPDWQQNILGLFMPTMRELKEMRFQWDRPYLTDGHRFAGRFNFTPTPFETGIPETARSFLKAAE